MQWEAPIAAVTVYPMQARVTRRAAGEVTAGTVELAITGLPASLVDESVRVAGRSSTAVRVVGVDLVHRDLVGAPEERVREAEAAVRAARAALAEIDVADTGAAAHQELLERLARRSGDRLAGALADGTAGADRVAEVGAAVAAQLAAVATQRRELDERRLDATRAVDAAVATLDRLRGYSLRRRDAVVTVEAEEAGQLELELVYLVGGASWSTAYDARLDGSGRLALTWYGMVTQGSGEDWPACELTLSTARVTGSRAVPELTPWWIDRRRPLPPAARPVPAAPMAVGSAPPGGPQRARAAARDTAMAMELAVAPVEAQAVEGVAAGSWRLPRPTAVPADGTAHRCTITTFDLPAELDHVVAPAMSSEAHLRAVVVNSTGQVLLGGRASTFLDDAFVGSTTIELVAPDAEIELALGVDDRIVVEREQLDRTAHRARFGSTRGAAERWETTITNRRAERATVTVRDRIPVSRDPDVKVVDVALQPAPAERDDLGRIEWKARIDPGETWRATVGFAVEHPKDVEVTGWR